MKLIAYSDSDFRAPDVFHPLDRASSDVVESSWYGSRKVEFPESKEGERGIMKKLMILATVLGILAMASMSFAQNIGVTFDESGTQTVIDGRSDLVPNPALGNLPSTPVFVIAYDIPEVFGYEYHITSSDATAIVGTPVFYPSTAANFGTNGDVRVGTGVCFHAGDAQAGPDPNQIRLAKHTYSWFALPTTDVTYCIGPVLITGDPYPNYTECVSSPTPLPFGIANFSQDTCTPDGCAAVVFQWEPDGVTPTVCQRDVVGSQEKSWGSLKSSF